MFAVLIATQPLFAQEAAAPAEPLEILTTSLPKAYVRQHYETQLHSKGGLLPLNWEVTEGNPPPGVVQQNDGRLVGTPTQTGEFQFTITVRDGSKPAYERSHNFSLVVVAPLLARWGRYPKVNGERIEGSVLVSNQTDHDFDLTFVVLAVNPIGRATAIGYQHFPLAKNTDEQEIPFGDNLPADAYQLNVDVVAEVAETNSIYRERLAPREKFTVAEGP